MTARAAKPASTERGTAFRLNVVLTTRAAQDLLTIKSGAAKEGENGATEAQVRELGAQALAELLDPRQAYAVYLRNGGAGNGSEQIIDLRVASDVPSGANAALMERLGGKSLTLVGTEKEDRYSGDGQFLVIGARVTPDVWGQKDAWSQAALVSFGVGEGQGRDDSGFPARLLAAIAKMPEPRAQRETVQRRLSDWHRYLGVLERTAKARQFSVTFKAFRRGPVNSHLIFTLDPGREPIEWDKLRSAVDEPLEVRERRGLSRTADAPTRARQGQAGDDDSDDWLLGYVVDSDPERNELRLALDEDVEKLLEHRSLTLPRSAALVYKASGDLAQVRRLKFGLEMLEQGYGENPRLSEFMFESGRAGRLATDNKRVALKRSELLQPRLNEGQRAAVEGALNAPDLFLIQGPPGTGKTTVIAEICYQNALRGQRTLIASQANLAVDHALSRLVHHPRIRALRRGRVDRVEVEGAAFLEDRVVGTWLAKTAESCERDLNARRDGIRRFEEMLQNRPRLEALAESLRRNRATRPQQESGIAGLQAQITPLKQRAEQTARALVRRREALAKLSQLQAGLGGPTLPAATGSPAAAEAEPAVLSTDLALLDRLQLHDRPAMQQLRDGVAELNAALDTWEREPQTEAAGNAGPPDEVATAAAGGVPLPAETTLPPARDSEPTFSATIRAAASVRQRAKLNTTRLAELRTHLDRLQQQGAGWLTGRDQEAALAQERAQLAETEAALNVRRTALDSEREALQAKVAELAAFDAAQAPTRAALRHWIEGLTPPGATGGLSAPPDEFGSPLGHEIWAAASETAQLYKLSALAYETRTSQAEARRLAQLAGQLSAAAAALLPELATSATPDAQLPAAGRRVTHWRRSSLRGLVALDAHGELHPAFNADAAWAHVEQELALLHRRPSWWQVVVGARQRQRQTLALWVERLKAAAEDFTRRRADLEALAAHRSERLAERAAATAEVLEAAVVRAAQTFGPQAEQRLAQVNAGLADVAQTQPAVALRLNQVDDQLAALAEGQSQRAADLEAGRQSLGEARPTRPFQLLLRHAGPGAGPIAAADWTAAWQTARVAFDQAMQALEALVQSVDPIAALGSLAADLEQDAARLDQSLEKARQAWRGIERDLQAARDQLRVLDEQQAKELAWWKTVHAALPDRLRSAATGPAGSAADPLEAIESMSQATASAAWDAELQQERDYVARADRLVTDWVRRLRAAAHDPRDGADLKQIYIDNANVIGITCVQAGAYQFSRAYRNFDCVIVDEVSKATPPELLLPMLKGKRVVLVGDHKQLPPMIGPETLADLAIEMEVPKSDLDHLERSLFKELFETAPPELRVMLTEQYRMHPQIMEAINQFYDGKLASGIAEPDRTRAHGFELSWLKPDNHLLWINTPSEGPFVEQRVGTTFLNAGELDVIVRLVKALDAAWAPSVASGLPPKEVGVITFYGAQVRELKAKLADRAASYKNLRLRVGTVDRFQGMERQVIIASLVRNNAQGSVGFARKPERVNVAFSRAQELLVIVGSREMFCERARDAGPGEGQVRAIYGRVAEVVARSGGQRRTTDVSDDFKR